MEAISNIRHSNFYRYINGAIKVGAAKPRPGKLMKYDKLSTKTI